MKHFVSSITEKISSKPCACGGSGCETQSIERDLSVHKDQAKIVILGSPNVGKSLLFNNLTGRYVTVSNYPGTTVEVARGIARFNDQVFEIIDTPGIYSFSPITEEERVTRSILLNESPSLVLHVIDAKNLVRMLPLTLQLIEASLPSALVLNMMDEARRLNLQVNHSALSRELGIPVIEAVATTGEGMAQLRQMLLSSLNTHDLFFGKARISYHGNENGTLDQQLEKMSTHLKGEYTISKRSLGLLLMSGNTDLWKLVEQKESDSLSDLRQIADEAGRSCAHPLELEIAMSLRHEAVHLAGRVLNKKEKQEGLRKFNNTLAELLSRAVMNPITGFPILFFILYWGLYQFVGVFGAGTVVDFLESTVFDQYLNPWMTQLSSAWIPWPVARDLFTGEYGVITLGVKYAVAIILPIVTFYFLVFALLEDTGYLPRLGMLMDRTFKKIGLNGRAVIPIVLGFGCDTMATMVTRTLATKRERVIATLLLALAIPCSAQLGVIMALLAPHGNALLLWALIVGFVFLATGFLTARILPGEKPSFYMELPPLRFPKLKNVLTKTYVRVKWYFREVLPLFIIASVLIWLGQLTRLFDFIIRMLKVPVHWIGLPSETASVFLMGFFRRDYGAAGLYDLAQTKILSGVELLVACVALTLFLPCIAQFLMNVKERGWKTGLGISLFTLLCSFGVAFLVNVSLRYFGVVL